MVDLVFKRLDRINYSIYTKIRELAPFGAANPEPIFKIEGLRILSGWSSGFEGRNLRLLLGNGHVQFKSTLIRGGAQRSSFPVGQVVNVVLSLESAWNSAEDASKQEIWLKILHLEPVDKTQ